MEYEYTDIKLTEKQRLKLQALYEAENPRPRNRRVMPEPILATEVRKKVIGNRRGLIVDDLDILLRRILDDNVYYATMEDCNIEKLERSDT